MHIIIFDNRYQNGYSLYDRTPDFPQQYESDVAAVCQQFTLGVTEDATAMVYRPLRDRYLLAVIFRLPGGSQNQDRGHYAVVNYLMDAEEADNLFRKPFDQMYRNILKGATDIFRNPGSLQYARTQNAPNRETVEFRADLEKCPENCQLYAPLLLCGGFYGSDRFADRAPRQIFIGTDQKPEMIIYCLQWVLPFALRKTMRFHIGIVSAQESGGLSLNIASIQQIDALRACQYAGGPASDKFSYHISGGQCAPTGTREDRETLQLCRRITDTISAISPRVFGFLREAITTWEEFEAMGAEGTGPERLKAVLRRIPEEKLMAVLSHMPLDPQTLKELKASTPRQYGRFARQLSQAFPSGRYAANHAGAPGRPNPEGTEPPGQGQPVPLGAAKKIPPQIIDASVVIAGILAMCLVLGKLFHMNVSELDTQIHITISVEAVIKFGYLAALMALSSILTIFIPKLIKHFKK